MSVDFRAKQLEFTNYIRDPERNPAPTDVKPERMAMYSRLIYNNIEDFLSGNFPVIRKILDDSQWQILVRDFIATHQAKTPYFAEIAEEFLDYLENTRQQPGDLPFLLELAHYEWVEMALLVANQQVVASTPVVALQLGDHVQLSPLAWLLLYRFPVQQISPDYLPTEAPAQPTALIAYRDASDAVKFMAINPITYRLLALIQEQGQGKDVLAHLTQVAAEAQSPNPDAVISGGLQVLQDLVQKGVVLVG